MDLRSLALLVCCVFMIEFGIDYVGGSVYVKGGSRYPFPRPQQSNTDAVQKNHMNSNKQPSRADSLSGSNRRIQREVLNSGIVTEGTVASIPSPATSLAALGNDQKQQISQAFEDQRPIDFDLNVRPMVQFIPGLKSVMN